MCSNPHEEAVPADVDANLHQSDVDVGVWSETASSDATEDGEEVDSVPSSCLGAIGEIDLAPSATLDTHDIVGILETADGPFIAWERQSSPSASPLVSHQLQLSRYDCEGNLAWTAGLPKDWDDFNIAPPFIPLSPIGAGGVFACAHDRCRAYGSTGNELWTTPDSHSLLGVYWANGEPAHLNPRRPESLVVWKDKQVRFEGSALHLATKPPRPAVWTLQLGTGGLDQVWTQPVPFEMWFDGALALVPWSSDPKDLHFKVLSVLPTATDDAILVFANMDYVQEWYEGNLYMRATPLLIRALPGGKWGAIKRLHVPLLAQPKEHASDGALHGAIWREGADAIVALSSHVVGNPLGAAVQNQFVELTPDGTIGAIVEIPGMAVSDNEHDGTPPSIAGRLLNLPGGNHAVVRRKLMKNTNGGGPESIPELVLLDRHGNFLAAAKCPLPWADQNKPESWEKLPIHEQLRRVAVVPAVSGIHLGSLLVSAERTLWRTTPWLQFDTKEAGVCAQLTLADCQDNDPCTADLCDPTNGCIHPAHPDGANCGSGKTCIAGKCVSATP